MRILRARQVVITLLSIIVMFSHSVNADIYGFNGVKITDFYTEVKFDQDEFKIFKTSDKLTLRIFDDKKQIREDAINNKQGIWVWKKILPFSEKLSFIILKDNKPVSIEYDADTRNLLNFSGKKGLPVIRAWDFLSTATTDIIETKPFPIPITKELENCKDKVLVIVYNKKNNILLWQYYGVLKKGLSSTPIEVSDDVNWNIIRDKGSCGH